MGNVLHDKNLGVRILLGVIVGILGLGMLLYLVPQGDTGASGVDVVAQVGNQSITSQDVQSQLSRVETNGTISPALRPLYTQQILNELIFEKELALEAQQMGIGVTDAERADRIRLMMPTAFTGGTFVGMDQYAAQVQASTGMTVPQFEDVVSQGLLEEKFRQLVTDGVTVTPAEIDQEFRRRNEKVKLGYVVIKPQDLESKINPSDADLLAYFEQNKARYTVPERRTVQYALLSTEQLRLHANISPDELHAYYNSNIDQYKLPDRAHVAHILFKTVGQTDAEAEETRKKAEDVLKKAKSGANFSDLAKQYSDDTTKDKGGDLGWIVRGQTVPEFEQAAFSLPIGSISDLVKTQYGFHIIKVIERQNARTQSMDEVLPSIMATLQEQKATTEADDLSAQIAAELRQSGRVPLDALAKKFNLTLGETKPLEANQPIPEVGNSPEVTDTIFRLRQGDDSPPIRTDLGYVVLSVKNIEPTHPGTLAEVHDKVLADYRHEKSVDMAKSEATDLARRVKSGEDLAKTAKSMGLEEKDSDFLARTGTIADVGTATQLSAAFTLPTGQTGDPIFLGANWVVYRVLDHQQPNPDDLAKQRADITQQLLDARREMVFEAFRTALDNRMKQDGTLRINADNLKRITTAAAS